MDRSLYYGNVFGLEWWSRPSNVSPFCQSLSQNLQNVFSFYNEEGRRTYPAREALLEVIPESVLQQL